MRLARFSSASQLVVVCSLILGLAYGCNSLHDAEDQELGPVECEGSCGGDGAGVRLASPRHLGFGGSSRTSRSQPVPTLYDSAHLDDAEAFEVTRSSDFVVVPYFSERLDQMNQFDPETHRFTSKYGDYYLVCASLAAASGAEYELDLFVNGARTQALMASNNGKAQGCRTVRLEAGQYVDVRALSTEDSGTTFASNSRWNWLSISYANGSTSLIDNPAFSIPTTTFTTVPYQTVLYGSAPGGVFTAPRNDYYRVCASMATFGQDFELDLFVDGQRNRAFAASRIGTAQGCYALPLSSGQVVDVRAHHYGAPVTVNPNSIWNWMTVDYGMYSRLNTLSAGTFSAETGQPTIIPNSAYTSLGETEDTVCASLASFTGEFELDLYVDGEFDKAIAWSSQGAATGCRTVHVKNGVVVDVRVLQTTGTTMAFPENSLWGWVGSYTY